MRTARILVSVLLSAVPFLVRATDSPHDPSISAAIAAAGCQACHMNHNAGGSALTSNSDGISNLCLGCHTAGGHGFPWSVDDQATPGAGGVSHRWNAVANSLGATPPTDTEMIKRLDDAGGAPGRLTCSVCHDQHNNTGRTGGSVYSSYTIGTQYGSGSAFLKVNSLGSTAVPKGYLVKINSTSGTATFKISNDNQTSWYGCSNPTIYSYSAVAAPPNTAGGCNVGTDVPLNDSMVRVALTGTFATTNQWKFYVTYPFLRISNVNSAMCLVCHPDRNMNHTRVAGNDPSYPANGSNVFSHPVGESLNANGGGYDRGDATTNNVLDANGALQTAGDGVASNDLKLGTSNTVHCMSCHSPHNADSNSLTELP